MQFLVSRAKEVYLRKDALRSLVTKNLKNRYSGTVLGFGWSVLNPILLAFVISFVFTYIFKTSGYNFTSFVLSGMLPWFFFASSLNESATSILNNSAILNQFSIPREMFPLTIACSNFIIFLTGLAILLPFFIIVNLQLLGTLIYLPALLIIYFSFILGLSFITASANIIFRDLAHILNIGLMLWMWVTPVFYSIDAVPLPYRRIISLNPVIPFISLFHALLHDNTISLAPYFLWSFAYGICSLFAGYIIFLKIEDKVIKRM